MNSQQKVIPGLLAIGLGFGCAGQQQQQDAKAPEPKVTQVKVGNISPVDLAVCFPKAPALPDKINKSVLTGLLVSSQPLVMECLVDPKHRGPADATEFTIESTLEGGKLTHKVTGTNLTPDGEKCIGAAVDRFVASAPDWSAKATATTTSVTAKSFPFQHNATSMPAVKMGTSEASDAAGTIRLAQSTFCDCYAAWKDSEPGELKASVKVTKNAAPVVTFDASTDATATQVAACLQPKVSALPLKTTSDEVTAPYTFFFANSMGTGMFTNAKPAMAFMQYDAVRTQTFGASLVADGSRLVAAEAYEALVQQYKKESKSVTIKQLQDGCDGLLKGHDGYIAALEKQLAVEEQAVAMLTDFAAKDASWAPVKEATAQQPGQTKKDLETAKATRAEDAATCAKLKI
ncbi:MAG: hypothetical protein IPM54_01815 [Polyangiaceae bacterium]|nr:hypothetical protein [Polyangiaceae bacterium]